MSKRIARIGLALSVLFAAGYIAGCGSDPVKPKPEDKVDKKDLIGEWVFGEAQNIKVFFATDASGSNLTLTGFQKFGNEWVKHPVNPMFLVAGFGKDSPEMAELNALGPMELMKMETSLSWDLDDAGKNLLITMKSKNNKFQPVVQVCPLTLANGVINAEIAGVPVKLTKSKIADFESGKTIRTQDKELFNTAWVLADLASIMSGGDGKLLFFSDLGLSVGGDLSQIDDIDQLLDDGINQLFNQFDVRAWYTEDNRLVLLNLTKGACQPIAPGIEDCAYSVTSEMKFIYDIGSFLPPTPPLPLPIPIPAIPQLTLTDEEGAETGLGGVWLDFFSGMSEFEI